MIALLAALLAVQNDKTQANGHDDLWETGWVTHCRTIYTTAGKTTGFVLQIGDSITHANPYSQWPRAGAGQTAEDGVTVAWCRANVAFSGTQTDTANKNGWYLAAADTSGNRGMTSSGGLDTAEFLSGNSNGGTAMPSTTNTATARGYVADGATYTANLQIDTVAAAFADAQFAVLMLGTNDASGGRSASAFIADLTSIVDRLEAKNIVVVLSTVPPHYSATALADSYNVQIRSFAQTRGLPLIDFNAEILARRPGTTWNGTLLGLNDVHPTASGGAYVSSSDPYSPGGNASTHTTGDACLNVGYLLRSWLTIQKLKEVKSYVADGVNPAPPPPPPPSPPPPPAPGPSPAGVPSDDSNDGRCGCGTVSSLDPSLYLALALLGAFALTLIPRFRTR
jgi:lysophospholipase L1-like esterase